MGSDQEMEQRQKLGAESYVFMFSNRLVVYHMEQCSCILEKI